MPGCVLRVCGEDFDVDTFLAQSSLEPCQVHRRGEMDRRGKMFSDSGLSLRVSEADGQLADEVRDAIRFLSEHGPELRRLQGFAGVTSLCLDFGHYRRKVTAQFDYLPPELIRLAGNLGLGIELSLYTASIESL